MVTDGKSRRAVTHPANERHYHARLLVWWESETGVHGSDTEAQQGLLYTHCKPGMSIIQPGTTLKAKRIVIPAIVR